MHTDSPSRRDSPSQKDDGSIEDDDEAEQEADLPMTMTASVILAGLPKDAKTALEGVAAGGVMGGGQGAVAEKGIPLVHSSYLVVLFSVFRYLHCDRVRSTLTVPCFMILSPNSPPSVPLF